MGDEYNALHYGNVLTSKCEGLRSPTGVDCFHGNSLIGSLVALTGASAVVWSVSMPTSSPPSS